MSFTLALGSASRAWTIRSPARILGAPPPPDRSPPPPPVRSPPSPAPGCLRRCCGCCPGDDVCALLRHVGRSSGAGDLTDLSPPPCFSFSLFSRAARFDACRQSTFPPGRVGSPSLGRLYRGCLLDDGLSFGAARARPPPPPPAASPASPPAARRVDAYRRLASSAERGAP
eukprot:30837-Pelagococcus_subviridis.AAC.28